MQFRQFLIIVLPHLISCNNLNIKKFIVLKIIIIYIYEKYFLFYMLKKQILNLYIYKIGMG